ncbi:MAG TPA: hypothetical protein VMU01_07955 [Rhizomicrobium sp.]|nr:hypothetical protein [Rhizomicrobium sp.]
MKKLAAPARMMTAASAGDACSKDDGPGIIPAVAYNNTAVFDAPLEETMR